MNLERKEALKIFWDKLLPKFRIGDIVRKPNSGWEGEVINIFEVDRKSQRRYCDGWEIGTWACVEEEGGTLHYAQFKELELVER